MKQLILSGLLVTSIIPATLVWGGEAAPEAMQYARVLTIEPVVWNNPTPVYRDDCQPQPQTFIHGNEFERYGPTVIGAVAGGLVGSQIGKNRSRPLTTLLGGVIGATVGHLAGEQQRRQIPPPQRYSEYDCQPQNDYVAGEAVEYDVTYYFDDRKFTETLPYIPGNWVRVWPDGTLIDEPESYERDALNRDQRYDGRRHSYSFANQ